MLIDFARIELKLSGVLTDELHEDVQDVVAPDQVELEELEESSELSEQLCIINRKASTRSKGIRKFRKKFFIYLFSFELLFK